MTHVSWTRGLLIAATLLSSVCDLAAQPEPGAPGRYIEFKVDPDYEAKLRERLFLEQKLGPLKELVNQVLADPTKMPADPSQLKGIDVKNEAFQAALKEWVSRDPELRKALEQWTAQKGVGKAGQDIGKLQKDMKRLLDQTPKREPAPPAIPPPRMDFTPVERDKKPPVSIGQLTEDAMKNAEKTRFGDWLRESPAWNRAMSDLRAQFGDPNATRFDADDWQQKLLQKDGTLWKLGESTVDQIRSMPRPNVSVPGLDNLVVPNVGAPGMPELGSESMPLLGTIATWALFVGIILAAGWQMVRWIRPKRRATNFASDGGPWPVRPEAVATPAELILAFDYLALLKLGSEAQSWNHRAIASHWRELAPAFALDTDALEHLYEQARYEDGISALSDADREQARRALVLLAEAL